MDGVTGPAPAAPGPGTGPAERGPAALRAALDKLEKGELESRLQVSYEDRFAWAAWPALALLFLAVVLPEGRRPRPPEEVEA